MFVWNKLFFKLNLLLSNYLKSNPLFFDKEIIEKECKKATFQVIKLVRFRLRDVELLLNQNPELQIVQLIRDPRAIYNSRRVFGWCVVSSSCWKPENICNDLRLDLRASALLSATYPGRYTLLRHEDLSRDPFGTTRNLLEVLGLREDSAAIQQFLKAHTSAAVNEVGELTRNSSETTVEWLAEMTWENVNEVQKYCREVIEGYHYKFFYTEDSFLEEGKKFGLRDSSGESLLTNTQIDLTETSIVKLSNLIVDVILPEISRK